ncbi:MAG: VOC family protein [Solirubrobacterales bacterium]|nr:VOC family protein [Solirubrobacterales bacterium]
MRATAINHVAISAPDLEASARFYTEVFGMERVPAPRFPSQPVAWLRLGDQQLHLFQREGAPERHHFGIDVDDFEAAYLKIRELEIRDATTFLGGIFELPGGEVQMYMRDPGGNLVEVDCPDIRALDREVVRDIVPLADLASQDAGSRTARLYPSHRYAAAGGDGDRQTAAPGESVR